MISKREMQAQLKGLLSFLPGSSFLVRKRGTQSAKQASYHYGIWLKHLTLLWESGYRKIPKSVAEFGPGDALGVGIAALLSGTSKYYALDVVQYSNQELNLSIFDEMVELFRSRSPRPSKGWPDYDHLLDDNLFPSHILTDEVLSSSLESKRVEKIRKALTQNISDTDITIKYIVPWSSSKALKDESVELTFSHSVLQYVDNLENLFAMIYRISKPGGVMSHQIDLTAHNTSDIWNGHRRFSEFSWKIISGNRPYFLNRLPFSHYYSSIGKSNFKVVTNLKQMRNDGLERKDLSPIWKAISEEDLRCSGVFIQATKVT